MFVIVDLVHHKQNRFARFAQQPGKVFVDRREAMPAVYHQQQDVALAECLVDRTTHFPGEFGFTGTKDSASVPNSEWPVSALADCRDPVASDPGLIVNDGDFAPDESIEQGGFSDVGASDDCHVVHIDKMSIF
jgi:hypothetical protein